MVKCSKCGSCLDHSKCDECDTPFAVGQKIVCEEGEYHYCNPDCFFEGYGTGSAKVIRWFVT